MLKFDDDGGLVTDRFKREMTRSPGSRTRQSDTTAAEVAMFFVFCVLIGLGMVFLIGAISGVTQ